MNSPAKHVEVSEESSDRSLFSLSGSGGLLLATLLAGATVGADFALGTFIQFPFLFVIPVMLVSWTHGKWWGLILALTLPLFRLYFVAHWDVPWTTLEAGVNAFIRIFVLSVLAVTAGYAAEKTHEVRIIHGLLPTCSHCKRIRNNNGEWEETETYIARRSRAQFSHTYCPDCVKKHYRRLQISSF
jgi:hypothetical protein